MTRVTVSRKPIASADGTTMFAEHQLTLGISDFRRIDNDSAAMNVNGLALGTPLIVWNGTGPADTGGDWTRTGVGSEGPGAAHSGSRGLNTELITSNSNVNFDNGSMINVADNYSQLSFWHQPKLFPKGAKFTVRWLDSSNAPVGDRVGIRQYLSDVVLDTWQKVVIPIEDFNLTGNVQKLRLRFTDQFNQRHFIDDVELTPPGTGGPFRFRVEAPNANTRYHVSRMTLIVSDSDAGWDDNKFINLTALEAGLLLRQRQLSTNDDLWKINCKTNVGLFGQYSPVETFTFGNGKLIVDFPIIPSKASVIITDDNVLDFVVRDDLSALDNMTAFVQYGIETIPT